MTEQKSEPPGIGDWVHVTMYHHDQESTSEAKVVGYVDKGTSRSLIVEFLADSRPYIVPVGRCRVYRRFGEKAKPKEEP